MLIENISSAGISLTDMHADKQKSALGVCSIIDQCDVQYTICDGGIPLRIIVIDHREYESDDLALNAAVNWMKLNKYSQFFVIVVSLTPIDKRKDRMKVVERYRKVLGLFRGQCDLQVHEHNILLWNQV